MTQEEKSLLLKDLCARLPYGVMADYVGECIKVKYVNPHLDMIYISYFGITKWEAIEVIKPYLRPMSSMTSRELYEVQNIIGKGVEIHDCFISIVDSSINTFSYLELQAVFDWFNSHHFDYRGLIEKGLALEAYEGMYDY